MNPIGIDPALDWLRIRHLLKIGLVAAFLVLLGDMLLGFGLINEGLSGIAQILSKYEAVPTARIVTSALLGMIGIPLEGLSYFAVYRMMVERSQRHAHWYRAGIFGILIFGGCGVHVPCCALVYYYHKMTELHAADVMAETLAFAEAFLIPATGIFLIFFVLLVVTQISAFLKGMTPLPRWCWIFSTASGVIFTVLLKLAGNHAVTNALSTGWISLGNIWMFGGLLWAIGKYAAKKERPFEAAACSEEEKNSIL